MAELMAAAYEQAASKYERLAASPHAEAASEYEHLLKSM